MKFGNPKYYPNEPNILIAASVPMEKIAHECCRLTQDNLMRMKAYDTGNLYRSYRVDEVKRNETWVVGSNVEYAPFIEFGTYKMAARPALGNAVNTIRRKYDGKGGRVQGGGV